MDANERSKAQEVVIRHLRSHASHQDYLATRHEDCPDAGCPEAYTNVAELLRQLADAVEGGLLTQPGDEGFPGSTGALWHDVDGDLWILCEDGQMRLRSVGPGVDTGEVAQFYGPMTRVDGAL